MNDQILKRLYTFGARVGKTPEELATLLDLSQPFHTQAGYHPAQLRAVCKAFPTLQLRWLLFDEGPMELSLQAVCEPCDVRVRLQAQVDSYQEALATMRLQLVPRNPEAAALLQPIEPPT